MEGEGREGGREGGKVREGGGRKRRGGREGDVFVYTIQFVVCSLTDSDWYPPDCSSERALHSSGLSSTENRPCTAATTSAP